MENSLYDKVIRNLKIKKQRVLDGKLNCIPFKLGAFTKDVPGIEKEQLVIVTAGSKVGKTQLCDWLYLYTPLEYTLKNPDKCRVKILYYSLEVSKEKKIQQMMCYLLFKMSNYNAHIDIKSLNSVFEGRPVDDRILELLETEEYKKFGKHLEEHVTFEDNIRNPTGIFLNVKEFLEKNGTWTTVNKEVHDMTTNTKVTRPVRDTYIPNDPELYVIVVIDHLALMNTEAKINDVRDAMILFSSKYALELRDKYKCTVVMVQQQAMSQEGVENKKLGMVLPSMNGLGEAKITARDANLILGLFSPHKLEIPKFFEYDIHYWQDNIRFMNVVGNREGGGNSVCPLLFDGATNTFLTLPLPNQDLSKYKTLVDRIRNDIYILPVTQVMAVIKPIYKNYKKLKKNVKNSNTWKNWKRKIHFHW
jgi:hypothetical protein